MTKWAGDNGAGCEWEHGCARWIGAALLLATLAPAAPAFAFDDDLGPADEILEILGHYASVSGHGTPLVAGMLTGNQAAVDQYGSHNMATIKQAGNGHHALIEQRGRGNDATITQKGYGHVAGIVQHGAANSATIHQKGEGNSAAIVQWGDGNHAHVGQIGSGLHLEGVRQVGNGQTFSSQVVQ